MLVGSARAVRGEIDRGERGGEPPGAARLPPRAESVSPSASSPSDHTKEVSSSMSTWPFLQTLEKKKHAETVLCHSEKRKQQSGKSGADKKRSERVQRVSSSAACMCGSAPVGVRCSEKLFELGIAHLLRCDASTFPNGVGELLRV